MFLLSVRYEIVLPKNDFKPYSRQVTRLVNSMDIIDFVVTLRIRLRQGFRIKLCYCWNSVDTGQLPCCLFLGSREVIFSTLIIRSVIRLRVTLY